MVHSPRLMNVLPNCALKCRAFVAYNDPIYGKEEVRLDVLFVNACPRGKGVSRTLRLADAFFEALKTFHPLLDIREHALPEMGLLPIDGKILAEREALIDAGAFEDPMFSLARDFLAAKSVVIAAPYWDLLFPAVLKVYIEHLSVRELTFRYRDDACYGLCSARRALFLTTSGDRLLGRNLGAEYIKEVMAMLGITKFDRVQGEGLDLRGADVSAILDRALAKTADIVRSWQADL